MGWTPFHPQPDQSLFLYFTGGIIFCGIVMFGWVWNKYLTRQDRRARLSQMSRLSGNRDGAREDSEPGDRVVPVKIKEKKK